MKRSEMLKVLENILNDYDCRENKERMASEILSRLEDAGMDPPMNPTGTFDNSWEDE